MKTMIGLVCCLTVTCATVLAERWDTDPGVVSISVNVHDEEGTVLAEGGPWAWSKNTWILNVAASGSNLGLGVSLLDDGGGVLYASSVSGLSLSASPFGPIGTPLLLFRDESGISVVGLSEPVLITFEDTPDGIQALVDVKPGSSLNPVNAKSKGGLPVAIIGSAELDVNLIKADSVRIGGVSPQRVTVADVSGEMVDGEGAPDGIVDLLVHVSVPELMAALGNVSDGDEMAIDVSAEMEDGTAVAGTGSITVLVKGKAKGKNKK